MKPVKKVSDKKHAKAEPKQKPEKVVVKTEKPEKAVKVVEKIETPEKVEKVVAAYKYVYAVGRRKTSISRVRLWEGKGEITINGIPAIEFLKGVGPNAIHHFEKPFIAVGRRNRFDGSIKVLGGGVHAQVGAIIHGVSRALDKFDSEFHKILRKQDFLTRDSREKERHKFGLMGARKHKASPKR